MDETPRWSAARVLHICLVAVCVSMVAVSAFFDPKTGQCGTQLYLAVRMYGGLLVDIITSIRPIGDERILEHVAGISVYVGFFSAMVTVWYLRGPRKWFVHGLLAWTAFYLASYFFFFPTTTCP